MTAIAEQVLDPALLLASRWGWAGCAHQCWPVWMSCPRPRRCRRCGPGWPTNEHLVSPLYAAQAWRQLAAVFGEQHARALFGLTNVLVMFGGSKDGAFNQEISTWSVRPGSPGRIGTPAPWPAAPSPVRILRSSPPKDPPAAGTTRFGDRRERQTDHRPAVPLHRRTVGRSAAGGPATSPRRVGGAVPRDSDRGGPGHRGPG